MSLALIDCPTGLAGNMLLAALFDLGVPLEVVHGPLAALGLAGAYRLELSERRSAGLRGLHLEVISLETQPPHRPWAELRQLLIEAPLEARLRQQVLAVFALLADAEAAVHGQPAEQVHFHEVGALDALVDVVGVCAALQHLGVERLICTPPPGGHGSIRTQHGLLPVPAPAVLEIARRRGVPLASSEGFPATELTTPTGLALAAVWADHFGLPPAHVPRALGVGLGSRELDRPNLLRLVQADGLEGQPDGPAGAILETVLEQSAQIDDMTPEDLAALAEQLRRGGAHEVFSQPIAMKKGRSGWLLTVLAAPEQAAALRQLWWRHSSTLGLREAWRRRWCLPRRRGHLLTPLGPVRIKRAQLGDGQWRLKPEHDDLLALAHQHDLPLQEVRLQVMAALAQGGAVQPEIAEPGP